MKSGERMDLSFSNLYVSNKGKTMKLIWNATRKLRDAIDCDDKTPHSRVGLNIVRYSLAPGSFRLFFLFRNKTV
jgi:hypothetical protein